MRRTKISVWTKCFFFFVVVMLFGSCDFFQETEDVKIVMPQWPPDSMHDWPELQRWRVSVFSGYEACEFYIEESVTEFMISDVGLLFDKNQITGMTARPLNKVKGSEDLDKDEFLFFYPCGAVYPPDCKGKRELALTWEGGWTAFLVGRLLSQNETLYCSKEETARFVQRFNWRKLGEVVSEKQKASLEDGKPFFNPWNCDTGKVISKIAHHNFSVTALNQEKPVPIEAEELSGAFIHPYVPENSGNGQILLYPNRNGSFLWNGKLVNVSADGKKLSLSASKIPIYKE